MILRSPFRHVIKPDLLHGEFWAQLLKQCQHIWILRNWQVMTSQLAHSSHHFLVDPPRSSVHCNASAQHKNPFVVTCQKSWLLSLQVTAAPLSMQVCCSLDTWTIWKGSGHSQGIPEICCLFGWKMSCYQLAISITLISTHGMAKHSKNTYW